MTRKQTLNCVMRKINKCLFGQTFAQAYSTRIRTRSSSSHHFGLGKTVCRRCSLYSVTIIQPLLSPPIPSSSVVVCQPSQVDQRETLYSHTPTTTEWIETRLPLTENRSQSTSALYYQQILLSAATNHSSSTLANKLNQHCRYKFPLISS